VALDPRIARFVPTFLDHSRQNVILMLDALERGDFEIVERLGHSMRGSGTSFGFPAITDLGAALEQSAGSADTETSRRWVSELSTCLDRIDTDRLRLS